MGKTLLLIEDDELLSRMYQTLLVNHGFSVKTVKNGDEGLQTALKDHPNLILLDIGLPKMDGMTLMHTLRQDPWGKNVPIIILTNFDANEARLAGVVQDHPAFYLVKSNNSPEKVVEKIKEILDAQPSSKP